MLAIFKRETRSYFTSVVGYVIIAAIFAFVALYYAANNLILGSPDFASILYYSVMVLLFVLPALLILFSNVIKHTTIRWIKPNKDPVRLTEQK